MTGRRACVVSAACTLTVVVVAAAAVAVLPELVTVGGAYEVGSAGLPAACFAIVYILGVAMQPWLLPGDRSQSGSKEC